MIKYIFLKGRGGLVAVEQYNYANYDGREHRMSVDWDRRCGFESPLGQMFFFNDVP